jgi:hypothetical protein
MIRPWTVSSVAALVLVAVLSALTALADASPPDPAWISGLYDDNDFDDVVGFITSNASLVDDVTTRHLRPPGILGAKVPQAPESVIAFFDGRSAVCPRAPPAS